jgi:predicted transcriptional regulator
MSEQVDPMTVRTDKKTISEIDAIAKTLDRSRNYVVNQALQQFLETNAWQLARIEEGLKDASAERVRPAEDVFADIATKHGWK